MGKIHLLDSNVINKIAAGEVVEKPSSVVKELIENSIDAGSKWIKIFIENGGKTLIRIVDDGEGISKDDLVQAVKKHATSKINSVDDLYNLTTLGFRGEALTSIGSVSKLKIISKIQSGKSGYAIEVEDGEITDGPYETNMQQGTDIIVKELFYNLPARLRFLKRDSTEEGYIKDIVIKQSLINKDVGFTLTISGKKVIHLPPTDNLISRIKQIFRGDDFLTDLRELNEFKNEVHIYGVYASPAYTRKRGSYIYTFVNNRVVINKTLQSSIINSFRTIIPKDRFPVIFLFIEVAPSKIDVNIHPSKLEIKFFQEQKIYNAIHGTITKNVNSGDISSFPVNKLSEKEFSSKETYRELVSKNYKEREIGNYNNNTNSFNTKNYDFQPKHITNTIRQPEKLDLNKTEEFEFDNINILGQLFDTYIVYTIKDEFFIMDQHAVYEKLIFVRLVESYYNKKPLSQKLLLPLELPLSNEEKNIIKKMTEYLSNIGFGIYLENQEYFINEIPTILTNINLPVNILIKDLLLEYKEGFKPLSLEETIKHIIGNISCKAAIKGNTRLSNEKMLQIIHESEAVEKSRFCPHGRPSVFRLTKKELEKIFLRDEH